MSKVTKLLHTRYRVNELERTVKFYREILGLEEIRAVRATVDEAVAIFRQRVLRALGVAMGEEKGGGPA